MGLRHHIDYPCSKIYGWHVEAGIFLLMPHHFMHNVYRQNAPEKVSTGSCEVSKSTEESLPVDFSKIDNRLPLKIQDSERTEYVSPVSLEQYFELIK